MKAIQGQIQQEGEDALAAVGLAASCVSSLICWGVQLEDGRLMAVGPAGGLEGMSGFARCMLDMSL